MGGGDKVVTPTPPPALTASQSAEDYAKALPQILQSQLEFQPQFDQATFDSFQKFAPQFAEITQNVLEQFSPNQAALGESLAGQALQGAEGGLSDELRNRYAENFRAITGNQVGSGLGASSIAKNLLLEDLAFRQYNQNLGLSLQNKVPLTAAFQQPSQFQVGNNFGQAFATGTAGQNAFIGGSRPFAVGGGSGAGSPLGLAAGVLGGVGGLATGLGGLGFKPFG